MMQNSNGANRCANTNNFHSNSCKVFNNSCSSHQRNESNGGNINLQCGSIKITCSPKHFYWIFGMAGLGVLGYCICKNKANSHEADNSIRKDNATSVNKVKEDNAHNENEIKLDVMRTKNEIMKMEVASSLRTQEFKERMSYRPKAAAPTHPTFDTFQTRMSALHNQLPMPDYSRIKVIKPFMDNCPTDKRPALLFSLLAAFGGLCFSKVRSMYLDEKMHAPNILVICEAESGAGKGDLKKIYDYIFERIILSDRAKMCNQQTNHIIQTVGIDSTKTKFMDILANNNGVHMVLFETEIVSVKSNFKSQNGLNPSCLRNAFDNDPIYKASSSKYTSKGSYPVYMNCIFTGTPIAIDKLMNKDEVEGGTARRFCFTTLPEACKMAESIKLPGKRQCNIEKLRDTIDDWRSRFVYTYDDKKQEVPCKEYPVNLEYVKSTLEQWIIEQLKEAQVKNCKERAQFARAFATIAFHCSIVLHMLAGEPTIQNKDKREAVRELTLFIANYCMETYLAKFVPGTSFGEDAAPNPETSPRKRELSPEELDYYYRLRGTMDENGKEIGYGTIAKTLGMNKYDLRNAFVRYEKHMGK